MEDKKRDCTIIENMSKIKMKEMGSTSQFKNFLSVGVCGVIGLGLVSVIPVDSVKNVFTPIFITAIAIPAYYGISSIIQKAMFNNLDSKLSKEKINENISFMREKNNSILESSYLKKF